MYERFTDRVKHVMQLANQEAQRFNHEYIGTEHVLLGLIKEGSGVAANVLKNLDVDLRKIRLEVEKLVQSEPDMVTMGKLPQTPRAKKVIEYSMEEARNLNHNYVGTEHILLGLLREQEGVAAQVLMNLGLKLEEVREEVLNLLGHTKEQRTPVPGEYIERWECRVCGLPCRVEIHTSDDELPEHLVKDNDRFRRRECFCKETAPVWVHLPSEEVREEVLNLLGHGPYTPEAENATLRKEVERLQEELYESNAWFCSSEQVMGKVLWQLDKATEHLDADGELVGSGQWRIRSICGCLREAARAVEEGEFENVADVVSLAKEIERLRAKVTEEHEYAETLAGTLAALNRALEECGLGGCDYSPEERKKTVSLMLTEIARLRRRTHEIQERADARNAGLHKAAVKHERLMADAHRQLEKYRQGQGIVRESLMETATVAALLAENEWLRKENRGLKDLVIDDGPIDGVAVSCLPDRHGGYERGSQRFAGDDVWWWFPTREAAEDALALAVEESCSVAAEAAGRTVGDG